MWSCHSTYALWFLVVIVKLEMITSIYSFILFDIDIDCSIFTLQLKMYDFVQWRYAKTVLATFFPWVATYLSLNTARNSVFNWLYLLSLLLTFVLWFWEFIFVKLYGAVVTNIGTGRRHVRTRDVCASTGSFSVQ